MEALPISKSCCFSIYFSHIFYIFYNIIIESSIEVKYTKKSENQKQISHRLSTIVPGNFLF